MSLNQEAHALVTQPDVIVRAANSFHSDNPTLQAMFPLALLNTGTQIAAANDGTAYVKTGDIPAEWLRDSTVQIEAAYLGYANDPQVAALMKAVIQRQAKYLALDPYANAFTADYGIWERKFELDSLSYPILLVWKYWKVTGDFSVFTPEVKRGLLSALRTMETEQDHNSKSKYSFSDENGVVQFSPVQKTGMIWTGFRPSDDQCAYNYLIPAEMMAVQALGALRELAEFANDSQTANRAEKLRLEVNAGIQKFGTAKGPNGRLIYAYEVDGLGNANLMDDANLPSLLSAPYFGYVSEFDPLYQNTREFVLSRANPYYYSGELARGVGSPHTPVGMVWPLALLAAGFTAGSSAEQQQMLTMLLASDPGDHRLHESFDPNNPKNYTRPDFGWPNAYFAEYINFLNGASAHPKPDTSDLGLNFATWP